MNRIAPVPLALPCPGRALGPAEPVFIVAEAGVNHNGSLRAALRLVRAAADARADAVKFQTFRTDRLVRSGTRTAVYQRVATGEKDQAAMLRRLELSEADFRRIAEECRAAQILFVSTPFDEESLRFVAGLGVPFLKIGSGDLTNLPLLREGARTGLPLVISTGMADLDDIDAARACLSGSAAGGAWSRTVLLHCVSQYPTPPELANVRAVPALISAEDPGKLLRDFLEVAKEHSETERKQGHALPLIDRTLEFLACRAAIKFGERLAPEEIERLLADAGDLDFSATCAHGRPTAIRLTLDDLERFFKRRG